MSGGRVPIIFFSAQSTRIRLLLPLVNCRWELDCRKVHFKLECVVYFKNNYTSSAVKAFWQDLYYYWCYCYYYKCQVLEFFGSLHTALFNPIFWNCAWAEHDWKRSVRFQVLKGMQNTFALWALNNCSKLSTNPAINIQSLTSGSGED